MKQLSLADEYMAENPSYLKEQIITYIGNKRSLLPFIGNAVSHVKSRIGKERISCADLFSGTGVVARYLKQHATKLSVNDLELYSEITNSCYLSNASELDLKVISEAIEHVKDVAERDLRPGFIADLYSPQNDDDIKPGERVFYTRRNASYIDTARMEIKSLPEEIQKFALAPLIAKASVHANTSGVFKGFYKSKGGIGQFGGHGKDALSRIKAPIDIDMPVFSNFECETSISRGDANKYFSNFSDAEFDLVYLDPPYNQHPYGSNYFMLNLISEYERPNEISNVSGIPVDWNRSLYNKKMHAEASLFSLIESCRSKFVLISYNSEGFVSHDSFLRGLSALGDISIFETSYNTFRGSRNLNQRASHVTEFLYLLEK